MFTLDVLSAILFLIVALVSPLKKPALASFFIYTLTYLAILLPDTEPYLFYLVYLFVLIFGIFIVNHSNIKRLYFYMACFMYVMVIDAMLFPDVQTFVYWLFPYAVFAFNLRVMWLLLKGNYNGICIHRNLNHSWLATLASWKIHKS